MIVGFCSGSEDYLWPLRDTRDLLQLLAMEELEVFYKPEKTRYTLRGPLLGRMELLRQLYMNGMHEIPLEMGMRLHFDPLGACQCLLVPFIASIEDILMDYFKVFGTKSCVFDDLCLFLDVYEKIDKEAVLRFIQQIQALVDSEPIDFDCSDEHLKTNVSSSFSWNAPCNRKPL